MAEVVGLRVFVFRVSLGFEKGLAIRVFRVLVEGRLGFGLGLNSLGFRL